MVIARSRISHQKSYARLARNTTQDRQGGIGMLADEAPRFRAGPVQAQIEVNFHQL
jgi:hypothetical protein